MVVLAEIIINHENTKFKSELESWDAWRPEGLDALALFDFQVYRLTGILALSLSSLMAHFVLS